jgi:hypothetical protein
MFTKAVSFFPSARLCLPVDPGLAPDGLMLSILCNLQGLTSHEWYLQMLSFLFHCGSTFFLHFGSPCDPVRYLLLGGSDPWPREISLWLSSEALSLALHPCLWMFSVFWTYVHSDHPALLWLFCITSLRVQFQWPPSCLMYQSSLAFST